MDSVSGCGDWKRAAEAVGVSPLLLDRPPGLELAAHRLTLAGRPRDAEEAYRELLRIEPDRSKTLVNLANLLLAQGRQADAAVVRRQIVEREVRALGLPPAEHDAALNFRLAVARLGPAPDRVPAGYVARSFDAYADRFEEHMTATLRYRGPELAGKALSRALPDPVTGLDVLDVGCGTGLAAPGLRRYARRLDGFDLAPGMLEKARSRGLYDDLALGDAVTVLPRRPGAYDLVVALDVVTYLGDLAPFFGTVALALRAGGRLLVTSEDGPDERYRLQSTGRFAHAPAYVRGAAALAGFEGELIEAVILREEMGRPVDFHLMVFRYEGRAAVSAGREP